MTDPERGPDNDDDECSDAVDIATTLIALCGMHPDEAVRVAEDLAAKHKAALEEQGEAGRILDEQATRRVRQMLGLASDDEEIEPPYVRMQDRVRARMQAEAQARAEGKTRAEVKKLVSKLPPDWLRPRGKQTLN